MNKIIVIAGPTGIGKTRLSIELAHKLDGEIINADSTQVYKDLDIATAKVTNDEMEGVIHHLLDIKSIDEDYSVYDYQRDSRMILDDILKRGKTPILVGGTGLYIKACLYDYQFNEQENINNYNDFTNDELYDKLLSIDPKTTIHVNNRKRIVRALNYYDLTKEPYSEKKKTNELLYDTIFIGLTTNRDQLYDRLNTRVDQMISNHLLDEAKQVYDSNIRSKAVMTPIGYKELFDYFDGKKDLQECIELIKKRSRNYAKRQYTWFNHQLPIHWIEVNFVDFEKTFDEALNYVLSIK